MNDGLMEFDRIILMTFHGLVTVETYVVSTGRKDDSHSTNEFF